MAFEITGQHLVAFLDEYVVDWKINEKGKTVSGDAGDSETLKHALQILSNSDEDLGLLLDETIFGQFYAFLKQDQGFSAPISFDALLSNNMRANDHDILYTKIMKLFFKDKKTQLYKSIEESLDSEDDDKHSDEFDKNSACALAVDTILDSVELLEKLIDARIELEISSANEIEHTDRNKAQSMRDVARLYRNAKPEILKKAAERAYKLFDKLKTVKGPTFKLEPSPFAPSEEENTAEAKVLRAALEYGLKVVVLSDLFREDIMSFDLDTLIADLSNAPAQNPNASALSDALITRTASVEPPTTPLSGEAVMRRLTELQEKVAGIGDLRDLRRVLKSAMDLDLAELGTESGCEGLSEASQQRLERQAKAHKADKDKANTKGPDGG